jgi:hypothetical protein
MSGSESLPHQSGLPIDMFHRKTNVCMSDKYTNHFPTGLKISSLIFSAILLTNILASLFFLLIDSV